MNQFTKADEKLWEKVERQFKGQYMEPQVTDHTQWIHAETDHGTEYIRYEDVFSGNREVTPPQPREIAPYVQGTVIGSIEIVRGFGARLSAPGYLDCTEWSVFKTASEAMNHLMDTYGNHDMEEMK